MKKTLPIMLLKSLNLLPNQEVKLELNNELSKKIILYSIEKHHSELVVLTPIDQIEEYPDLNDLPKVSVIAKIKSNIELPNGNFRITIRGLFRAELFDFKNNRKEEDILECSYKKLEIPKIDVLEAKAVKRKLISNITKYVKNAPGVSNSILNTVKETEDLNKLTDLIANFLPIPLLRKMEYVGQINPVIRGENLLEDLNYELEIIKLDQKLDQKLHHSLEENQKEFILKEKIRVIEEELGDYNAKEQEILKYYEKLNSLKIKNPETVLKITNEIKKLESTNEANPEIANIRNYLEWILNLPWNNSSKDETDISVIGKKLERTHFGVQEAKEKIIEYIAAKNRNPDVFSPILCLIGPPGVGKTTFAKSVAESLNKEFYKISVGGLNDSAILNGHRRTYLGANPGKIIEGMKRTKTNNPLILIDEVDKMVRDYKGDPASILLDILDKSQNREFIDNYLEEPFDLSNILFILTANRAYDIPYELYDRLEIVELSSYTLLEKLEIAKKYLLPNIYKEHFISSKDIKFSDNLLKEIIECYTDEAGVRELERVLTRILRKLIVLNKTEKTKLDQELLIELLGPRKYDMISTFETIMPGIVNGLAVSSSGGIVMPIESVFYDGNGEVKVTGMLEQIMDESVLVALSFVKSHKEKYEIKNNDLNAKNIHIHMFDGATKKDGPSAGVAITTSIIGLALNKNISKDIAMTGEITLNGFVKKIGGLKEKLIGAYNSGIKKIYIPKENHNDLLNIPNEVLKNLDIQEIIHYDEIYEDLFKKLS